MDQRRAEAGACASSIESHSTRSEAASDELDGPTLTKMFRAQARAVEVIEKDPTPFIHYFVAETGGLLEPERVPDLAAAARRRRSPTRASASTTRTTGR